MRSSAKGVRKSRATLSVSARAICKCALAAGLSLFLASAYEVAWIIYKIPMYSNADPDKLMSIRQKLGIIDVIIGHFFYVITEYALETMPLMLSLYFSFALCRSIYSNRLSLYAKIKDGVILDCLLPADEIGHRVIELEKGRDRWIKKYGRNFGEILYIWQCLMVVVLFWFDRVVVRVISKIVKRS